MMKTVLYSKITDYSPLTNLFMLPTLTKPTAKRWKRAPCPLKITHTAAAAGLWIRLEYMVGEEVTDGGVVADYRNSNL